METFQFPLLIIKEVTPLLYRDSEVFAYSIMALTRTGDVVYLYENRGLDLTNYIGKEVECCLEITRGRFEYEGDEMLDPKSVHFQYKCLKRMHEYFPELVKLRNDWNEGNSNDQDGLENAFESAAALCFKEWGLNGLNFEVYQSKPLVSSEFGYFFINEYVFDEELEDLDFNDEVYIKLDELYLRGVRPYIPEEELVKVIKQGRVGRKDSPQAPHKEAQTQRFQFSID